MSIGPASGVPASAAGVSLAQTKGSEVDRGRHELGAAQRSTHYAEKAEAAAGVGETDGEDHETAERDGDGRSPWQPAPARDAKPKSASPPAKDLTGQSGTFLDLTG